MTMPAGKYYIGDLCYVLNQPGEWDEFCKLTITAAKCLDGEFILPDGRRFATYGTAYGDGQYPDNQGNSYGVDAGLIGCILMSDIPSVSEQEAADCGAVVNFSHDFETGSHEGVIRFGWVRIDTSYDEPEEFDEENDADAW
jgi:hypothetical protein